MRKVYKIMLIIFITLIILLGLYYVQYPIRVDRVSLEMEIQDFEPEKDITVQNVKIIDNKILALYTYSDGMGYATFNKGFNGRCLLVSTNNINGNSFLIGFIDTNKDNYKIFAGKNYDNKIKSVEFIAAKEKNFVADISKENYYILPISDPTGEFSFLDFALYDENGKNIKQEIVSKYFSKNSGEYAKSKVELAFFNLWYVLVTLVSGNAIYFECRTNKKNSIEM
ncbi:hypothetical protein [Clostridium sp.]|uniref:hypothetical protein n=1 Tax=Clostridium sp. TaxID=1506 RepID=UPI002FC88CC4